MNALVQFIWNDKKDVLLALLAGTVGGLTAVALFAQSGLLIAKAALLTPFYIILILTAFLKLFGVTKSISKYAERLLTHRVTFRFISKIRMLFFDRLLPQSHVLNTYTSGDLLTRITANVETVQNFFLRVLYPPCVTVIVFLATIIFMLFFSPWIALTLLIGMLVTTILVPFVLTNLRYVTSDQQQKQLTEAATEYFYGYRELLLHNQLQNKEQALLQLSTNFSQRKQQQLSKEQSALIWNQLVALLTTFIILLLGAYLTSTSQLDGVYLALIVLVSLTVFESAIPLAMAPNYLRQTKQAMDELNEVSKSEREDTTIELNESINSIEFRHVSFRYPTIERSAVQNISLRIQKGQKIAIVGPSGSGKSTIMQLLMAEFTPTNGEVLINSQNLNNINKDSYYQQLSTTLQHNHFFSGTIRSNLLFAQPNASDEQLNKALEQALLPISLDHEILEKGENLSGGEKQRLAFARFLLKDSSLCLLDEPFTSLDVHTEQQLMERLLTSTANKTLIVITHKLEALDQFDMIFVMHNGTLVEMGTHDQLLAQQHLYYLMVNKHI